MRWRELVSSTTCSTLFNLFKHDSCHVITTSKTFLCKTLICFIWLILKFLYNDHINDRFKFDLTTTECTTPFSIAIGAFEFSISSCFTSEGAWLFNFVNIKFCITQIIIRNNWIRVDSF